ncbi:hypothetical protein F4780DRAFT_401442 [Xylariomycetidae sp. FL0641]|nr:hypothetical protein F4780DRAFT_401442 [Xylariomycetidae sp. FL0641]
MADRGTMVPRAHRAPLSDTTKQVVNSSSKQLEKPFRSQDSDVHPLRAHPAKPNVRPTSGSSSRSRPTSLVSKAMGSTAKVPSNHRLSAISQDDSEPGKRDSQFSHSSGTSSGNRKTHIGPWELGKTLGKGSAARVRLARHQTTQDLVAVKIMAKHNTYLTMAGSLAELDKWDRNREEYTTERHMPLTIEREVAILKLIDHPGIVKLHDIWENRCEIYLVMEYMDAGDLFAYVNSHGPLGEEEMMYYFRQILTALDHVHSFHICHRDLKPENILMTADNRVKIADFGMAAMQQSPNHSLKTSCGSPHYAAPELVSRKQYRGDKVDIWSLGVILYACMCAQLPFDDPHGNVPRLLAKSAKGEYYMPDWLPEGSRDLIDRMLQIDPNKRISSRRIWQHPMVQRYDYLDDYNDGGRTLKSRNTERCRPVMPEDLDMPTLRQLKAMWHTFSEKHLAMQLMSPEPNDQKMFYWLLCEYKERQLENFATGLTHSSSDYHHLRPVHWKKKYTTAEFPSRYGRTPSRFTVISNVASDQGNDWVDATTDGGGTIQSYDPYKSSLVMDDDIVASRANIVIHRNNSSAKGSSRSSRLRRARSGSLRSSSTCTRLGKGGRHITAAASVRASRRSLGSVKSGDGGPYLRPASRHKRGVDFSRVRQNSARPRDDHVPHAPASIAGDDSTYDRDFKSPIGSMRQSQLARRTGGKAAAYTQSLANVNRPKTDGWLYTEEMDLFTSSIAKDCDEAFNSSLLIPQSYMEEDSFEPSPAGNGRRISVASAPANATAPTTITSAATDAPDETSSWNSRPLPPAPPMTDSVRHEIKMAKRRAERRKDQAPEVSNHATLMATAANCTTGSNLSAPTDESDLRAVSAPIYSQFSTQWGKDTIPLPSISERQKEDSRSSHKPRTVSAPTQSSKSRPHAAKERAGLDYLAHQENTIRVVTSPSALPAPLNIPRKASRNVNAPPKPRQEPGLRRESVNVKVGRQETIPEEPLTPTQEDSPIPAKKKSSWFKRNSKDKDDAFTTKAGSVSSTTDFVTCTDTTSTAAAPIPPARRKKSFSLAFWRTPKDPAYMQLANAGCDVEDATLRGPTRRSSRSIRPGRDKESKVEDEYVNRNVETHQNWLARLFRVKPVVKHLCFSSTRRRARQEIAFLLRDWRKYGVRDIQIDKERCIVFGRVAKKNLLNLRPVSFAAEIMTVIEHGRRGPLCIARFTQEKGAASSFHTVVDTTETVMASRSLLVTDKRRAKMMINTLNVGGPSDRERRS